MPSLTPNEDKVRAWALPIPLAALQDKPGPEGARARIAVAMHEAYMVVYAKEIDRGTDPIVALSAFASALGLVVASLACSYGDAAPHVVRALAGEIAGTALRSRHLGDDEGAIELEVPGSA